MSVTAAELVMLREHCNHCPYGWPLWIKPQLAATVSLWHHSITTASAGQACEP